MVLEAMNNFGSNSMTHDSYNGSPGETKRPKGILKGRSRPDGIGLFGLSRTVPSGDESLLVFGYSAKLFKDDLRAKEMDQGVHLIPWNGDQQLLIDRFDGRGHFTARELVMYDSSSRFEPFPRSDNQLEEELNRERFADLASAEEAELQEEEMKRLRMELASEGAYNQVSFNYDGDESQKEVKEDEKNDSKEVKEGEKNDFKLPEKLKIPENIQLPKSMIEHKLIVKTASFVAEKGPQIEVVIKLKQSSNPAFSFLSLDSNLNPYYKHLIGLIKSGQYSVQDDENEKKEEVEESDSSDEEEGYLHPSLMGKKSSNEMRRANEPMNLPYLPTSSVTVSDSYRKLVDSLKGHMSSDEEEEVPVNVDPVMTSSSSGNVIEALPVINDRLISERLISSQLISSHLINASSLSGKPSKFSLLPPPPPEVETIIERLAERVAKNGPEFEADIKRRADPRFDFLNPGHCFHSFYTKRKLELMAKRKENDLIRKVEPRMEDEKMAKIIKPVKFSLPTPSIRSKPSSYDQPKVKPEVKEEEEDSQSSTDRILEKSEKSDRRKGVSEDPKSGFARIDVDGSLLLHVSSARSIEEDNSLAEKVSQVARERLQKEKQEERKQKAALFLSLIKGREQVSKIDPQKSQSSDSTTSSCNEHPPSSIESPSISSASVYPHLPFTSKDESLEDQRSANDRGHHLSEKRELRKEERKRRRSRSRERQRSRSRDRKRSRSRERQRSRSRDRKRSKSRDRQRSRSRERQRRRSRDRHSDHRHRRSRDRSHERSRSKKRDRSKERYKKRSRSRSRS